MALKARERAAAKRQSRQDDAPDDVADAPVAGNATGGLTTLRHDEIRPDPNNARRTFDADELALLADSIYANGLLQNLVVDADNVLIAGERRWRAIGLLIGWAKWPADRPIPVNRAVDLTHEERAITALLENLQRVDLKPLEEARAFQALRDVHGLSTDDIAGRIHRSQRLVQQRLQLLGLNAAEQANLDAGRMTVEGARSLLAAKPKPVELTPLQLVALLELTHKIGQEPEPKDQYAWRETEVAATAPAQEFPANLFQVSRRFNTGRSYARFPTYNSPRQVTLDALAPLWRTDIWRAIAVACDAVAPDDLPPNTALYRTPWLNGPFEVPAEVLERIEADKKAGERNTALWAERDAEEKRQHERLQGAIAKAQRLADDWTAPFQAFALRELMTEMGNPLPWKWVEETEETDGGLVDANGDDVPLEDLIYQPGFDRIFVNLLNDAAADRATADPDADVPSALRRLAS